MQSIAVVDYKSGNLLSIKRAVEKFNTKVKITSDYDEILSSDIHILISKNKYFLASKFGVTSIYIDSVYKDKMNKIMSI